MPAILRLVSCRENPVVVIKERRSLARHVLDIGAWRTRLSDFSRFWIVPRSMYLGVGRGSRYAHAGKMVRLLISRVSPWSPVDIELAGVFVCHGFKIGSTRIYRDRPVRSNRRSNITENV